MRNFLLVIGLLIVMAIPLISQDDTPTPDYTVALCEDAQGFYDAAQPIVNDITAQVELMLAAEDSAGYRDQRAIADDLYNQLLELPFPECAAYAHDRLVEAVPHLLDGAESLALGDTATYIQELATYSRGIGEARGYLVALGVDVDTEGDVTDE